jgi:O-antigen/teichoic acid export membrane protein
MMLVSYAILIGPIIVWARPINDLILGSRYAAAARVVQLLVPYLYLLGVATLLSEGVTYFGEARRRFVVSTIALIVNAGLDLLLLPAVGVTGASWATDAGFVVLVTGLLWTCRVEIGLQLRPLLLTMIRSIGAAAIVWLVLTLLGGSDMSVPVAVIGAALILPVFLGALLLSGEVRFPEIAGWWQAARRIFERTARPPAGQDETLR